MSSVSFAHTVDITLSDHVPGVEYKKQPSLNFQRNGVLVDSQKAITDGKLLSENSAKGQKTPLDVILANTWLIKTGQFAKIRQQLNSLTDEQKKFLSDDIMKQMQSFYQKLDSIQTIAELQSKDNLGIWVIYQAKGNNSNTIYIDFVKQIGNAYFPAFGDLENDPEVSNIMNALITENIKHVSGLITLKKVD